jgi:hypothetical protein
MFREFVGAAAEHAGEEPADGGELAEPASADPGPDGGSERDSIGISRSATERR